MSHTTERHAPLSIAAVSLSGELLEKVAAISEAGFDGMELFENDLTFSATRPAELRARMSDLGLTLFALQPFRDFEGSTLGAAPPSIGPRRSST